MIDVPRDLATALGLNCQVFLDSCLGPKFSLFVNRLQVLAYVLLGRLKQICHRLLRKPNCLVAQSYFDASPPILGLVENELTGILGRQ